MRRLVFGELSLQNFLSFGEKRVRVRLDQPGLTCVIGKNLDSTDDDAANGCGKSALLDGISYVLFGKPIRRVKKIVNRFNKKKLLGSIEFTLDSKEYRIVRGQHPTYIKMYCRPSGDVRPWDHVSDGVPIFDVTLDSVANTNSRIEEILCMDHELFRRMVVDTIRIEGFFDSESSVQKSIIESLFNFTVLSKKTKSISETRKVLESELSVERARLEERRVSYDRQMETIRTLREKSSIWSKRRNDRMEELRELLVDMESIDLESAKKDIERAKTQLEAYKMAQAEYEVAMCDPSMTALRSKETALGARITKNRRRLEQLSGYDAREFIDALENNESIDSQIREISKDIRYHNADRIRLDGQISDIKEEIKDLSIGENCPKCGQKWPDLEHRKVEISKLEEFKNKIILEFNEKDRLIAELDAKVTGLKKAKIDISRMPFKTKEEALSAEGEIKSLGEAISSDNASMVEITDILDAHQSRCDALKNKASQLLKGLEPTEMTEADIREIEDQLRDSRIELSRLEKEEDPHIGTADAMESSLVIPSDEAVRNLSSSITHHRFMEQLLSKKDSPLRRMLTARWLDSLNTKLSKILKELDLPYTVEFDDDLSPSIRHFDEEIDYDGLSTGELQRVSLALNRSFRELFEETNFWINFTGIDERLDVGLDASGLKRAMECLESLAYEDGRSVWVVSHKKEVLDHADRMVTLTKENGFSSVHQEAA